MNLARISSTDALRKAQKAFEGVAAELGNPSEDDIQGWVDEIRYVGRCGESSDEE